ncbi:MAG: flavodoxin-dependent (E)-4-hydroxy-3-methylbut-2-enyl-diphosphate synthase [Candidatus Omnitrophica bacterium]|nr:flavodoxin-dependent (E)-4-hydroxy-3-methylbut-2-enyl-diphosphate synthase [Candidatus Omnitrophota bacterium]MDD5310784.1 flavodoxin-dependent (E)-4-hydroxy-3-methylbut-2-enyl-diphosphate synthase [Candidatus Omnitrophota bacterium]MDD5546831.1 flavodoxin-dependent (E)-4-hydroxy-3-methylbut-2-enyl-diphosphate synthase [Candidatus Omnitrophota bacterium]
MKIIRRKTRTINLGGVKIGGTSPVSVQSMTKTDTLDVAATVAQIKKLELAGCDIVRTAVKDASCCDALARIMKKINIPLEADIHFDYRLAIKAIEAGVDGVRLNPGNVCKKDEVAAVINLAKKRSIPVRVGVNSGSVRIPKGGVSREKFPALMVKAALDYIKMIEDLNFRNLMVSLKVSDVGQTIDAYRLMAKKCDYPFHLGVTAAGPELSGTVKSTLGIGILLAEGIGDTIRVSLTGDPVQEVIVGKNIIQGLGLRRFGPEVLSCPTCGRTEVDIIGIANKVEQALGKIKDEKGKLSGLRVAVMGCVVNGPGEAKEADLGIAAGKGSGFLFIKGKPARKIKESEFVSAIVTEINKILRG